MTTRGGDSVVQLDGAKPVARDAGAARGDLDAHSMLLPAEVVAMQMHELFALADRLAPSLRALDAVLADAPPAATAATPYTDAELDTACGDLERHVERVTQALQAAASDPTRGGATFAAPLGITVEGLALIYRRACAPPPLSNLPTLHERLAEAARDTLIDLADALARIIDAIATLAIRIGAAGGLGSASIEFTVHFNAPSNAQELAVRPPSSRVYDRDATARALRDAERCGNGAVRATGVARGTEFAVNAPAPQAPERRCPGLGLSSIVVGLLIGNAIAGSNHD